MSLRTWIGGLLFAFILGAIVASPWDPRPRLDPDSHKYMTAAENLLSGRGVMAGCGRASWPLTHWAPLYSVALAAARGVGFDRFAAPLWVNATALGTALAAAGWLLIVFGASPGLAAAALVALACHWASVLCARSALADAMSWPLLVIVLALVAKRGREARFAPAALLGVVLGLGCLTRYAFVGIAGGALLAWVGLGAQAGRFREAARSAALAALLTGVFLGTWLYRNEQVGGDPFLAGGPRREFVADLGRAAQGVAQGVLASSRIGPVLAGLFLIVILTCWVRWSWSVVRVGLGRASSGAAGNLVLASALMAATYSAWILAVRWTLDPVSLDTRMFSPVWWLLLIGAFASLAARGPAELNRSTVVGWALAVAVAFLSFAAIGLQKREPRPDYWRLQGSPAVAGALARAPGDAIFATDPEAFWFWDDACVQWMPPQVSGLEVLTVARTRLPERRLLLVWLDSTHRANVLPPEAVPASWIAGQEVLPDGRILEVLPWATR